jgi:hypothetical protein
MDTLDRESMTSRHRYLVTSQAEYHNPFYESPQPTGQTRHLARSKCRRDSVPESTDFGLQVTWHSGAASIALTLATEEDLAE